MIQNDLYYFNKVLRRYKLYYQFKKGIKRCIKKYTKKYPYRPLTWEELIGMYCLEDSKNFIKLFNRYRNSEFGVPYSTQTIIKIVLLETLGRRDDLSKISYEIYLEIIHS